MKTRESEVEKLKSFSFEELATTNNKIVAKGHTPLWAYWEEFIKRYSRLGRSIDTMTNVKDALRWAVLHLEITSIEQCFDTLHLEDLFHQYKEERSIAGGTFNSYRKNLNTYFSWLKRYQFIDENPILRINKCDEKYRQKNIQTDEQLAKISYLLSTKRSTSFERARNLLFLDILRVTGARPKEILDLKLSDISPIGSTHKITIHGIKQKGKLRPYRMKGFLKDSYDRYMSLRTKIRMDEPWLFISRKHGEPWGDKGMRYLFRSLSSELGFTITAYGFRRYVATSLKKNGLSENKISDHLGHASPKTTRSYLDDLCEWTDEGVDILTRTK